MADCNCWQCQAERLFSARRTQYMRPGKVYMYQLYNELFEEFDRMEDAEAFRAYADENIPYWDYDPVKTIDMNDPELIIVYKHKGWLREESDV